MTRARAESDIRSRDTEPAPRRGALGTFRLSADMFDQFCSGTVEPDTMALLQRSQHSRRRLALRALLDQLGANPNVVGSLVDPEQAWQILAEAERQDANAVADILLYPTVGVWLTRALHHTRPDKPDSAPWPELGYLHLIAAAAAIRADIPRTIRVPVWHGEVSLPTVGHIRLPGMFPIGTAEMICHGTTSRLRVGDRVLASLDGSTDLFSATLYHTCESRGLTLRASVEDRDPYRGFAEPRPPTTLADSDLAEWRKLVAEAWDVLTLHHRDHARELATGLRALVPIPPGSDVVGSSSPAAFGGMALSGNGSATKIAEAMVHELQHSKINALLELVELAEDDREPRCYAPWRDDPRPVLGVLHGVVAFSSGVEFWSTQRTLAQSSDLRAIDFEIVLRRQQVRLAARLLSGSGKLSPAGQTLVDALSQRLEISENAEVSTDVTEIVDAMVDDHQAIWRLRFIRPDAKVVDALASSWVSDTSSPKWSSADSVVLPDDGRRLPAGRRNLLRTKALDPDLFAALLRQPASLPGTTPRADATLCSGDNGGAATAYQVRVRTDPADVHAWVGLGLALRGLCHHRAAAALLERPEITIAAYHRIRRVYGEQPDPTEFARWVGAAS